MRYQFEDYILDTDRRELSRRNHIVPVAPQVFDLLNYLVRNRERVVSKDDLIAAVWDGRFVSDAAVTTRLNVARSAIGDSGQDQRLIKTLPRRGFRFVGAVRQEQGPAAAAVADSAAEPLKPVLALPDRPSIAVLAFSNLSGDPKQEYFADGIVEDIITELSRFRELFVIARNSSFQYKGRATDVRQVGRELGVRYVLEGSVRRGEGRLRICAQLIDADAGTHRWAEHYDRKLEDVFAVRDEVVGTIAAILAAHVRKAEIERTRAKPPNSWKAYDCYLQAADAYASFVSSLNVEDLYEARRLLHQSLAIDANYARSYAMLASTHSSAWVNPLDGNFLNPGVLDQAHQLVRKAVQLDPNLPEAHAVLALILAWKHQHDASIAEFERATALNPNYVDWRFGWPLVLAGNSRRAIQVLEANMRLDPFHAPLASFFTGVAHLMLNEYSQALAVLRDFVSRAPKHHGGHVWLAVTHAYMGQLDEARAEVAQALRLRPDFTIAATRQIIAFKLAKDGKHFFDGLRRAGLPED